MAQRDIDKVMALKRTDIRGPDFSVLVVLAWHVNEIDGQCNPAYETIAREAHISRDTVYRSILRLKRLGLLSFQSGFGRTSTRYVLNLGVGGEPSQSALRAQSAYSESPLRPGGELPELNPSVSDSVSASVSVEQFNSTQKTEDKRQQQEQEQRQNQRLGGITPEPAIKQHPVPSSCLELERVWKEVTKAPCYPRNFIPLLGEYTVQHIAAVIRWAFTVSNHWTIKSTGAFCKQANGRFPVFAVVSGQYERYMQSVREEDETEARELASRTAISPGTSLTDSDVRPFTKQPEIDRLLEPEEDQDSNWNATPLWSPHIERTRIPSPPVQKRTIPAPIEEDPYVTPKRCLSVWKGKYPGRPCDEYDFDCLLDHFDEDDIVYAIRTFPEHGYWSEEIGNSGDFRDNFSEILEDVKPHEPTMPDEDEP